MQEIADRERDLKIILKWHTVLNSMYAVIPFVKLITFFIVLAKVM